MTIQTMGAKHDGLLIVLTILVFIFSVLTFFGVGTYVAITDENGGFEAILDKYTTKLSPPAWSYYIWFLVGIWQVAWILYVLTTICRYTDTGPMYRQPPVISKLFMWGYLVALLLNGVALLFLVNDFLLLFVIFMLLLWFTLALTMVYLHVRMDEYFVLMGLKFRGELNSHVFFLQNGVAFYAGVTSVQSAIAICSGGVYIGGLSLTSASCLAIAIFFVLLVGYFVLDLTVWDRYLRYTFAVYPPIIWFLLVAIYGNWDPWSPSNILPLVLLLISVVMFIIKLFYVLMRNSKSWSLYVEGQYLSVL